MRRSLCTGPPARVGAESPRIHGDGEIRGTASSDQDLVVSLEAAGITDLDAVLDDRWWIEWRGGAAHAWRPA